MTIQTTVRRTTSEKEKCGAEISDFISHARVTLSLQLLFVVHRIKKISICLQHFYSEREGNISIKVMNSIQRKRAVVG